MDSKERLEYYQEIARERNRKVSLYATDPKETRCFENGYRVENLMEGGWELSFGIVDTNIEGRKIWDDIKRKRTRLPLLNPWGFMNQSDRSFLSMHQVPFPIELITAKVNTDLSVEAWSIKPAAVIEFNTQPVFRDLHFKTEESESLSAAQDFVFTAFPLTGKNTETKIITEFFRAEVQKKLASLPGASLMRSKSFNKFPQMFLDYEAAFAPFSSPVRDFASFVNLSSLRGQPFSEKETKGVLGESYEIQASKELNDWSIHYKNPIPQIMSHQVPVKERGRLLELILAEIQMGVRGNTNRIIEQVFTDYKRERSLFGFRKALISHISGDLQTEHSVYNHLQQKNKILEKISRECFSKYLISKEDLPVVLS